MDKEYYKEKFDEILNALEESKSEHCARIRGSFGSFCPELQHITIDALKPQDVPNNIDDNSIFLTFCFDFSKNQVEVKRWGHIYLCPEESKATNMAMASMKAIAIARDVKWMRKSKIKTTDDLVAKLYGFFENVMNAVEQYTGGNGYPYKRGVEWVDPQH